MVVNEKSFTLSALLWWDNDWYVMVCLRTIIGVFLQCSPGLLCDSDAGGSGKCVDTALSALYLCHV